MKMYLNKKTVSLKKGQDFRCLIKTCTGVNSVMMLMHDQDLLSVWNQKLSIIVPNLTVNLTRKIIK